MRDHRPVTLYFSFLPDKSHAEQLWTLNTQWFSVPFALTLQLSPHYSQPLPGLFPSTRLVGDSVRGFRQGTRHQRNTLLSTDPLPGPGPVRILNNFRCYQAQGGDGQQRADAQRWSRGRPRPRHPARLHCCASCPPARSHPSSSPPQLADALPSAHPLGSLPDCL